MTEKELFIAICKEDPAAMPVFAQSWWMDAICDDPHEWNVSVAMRGDQVIGAWPYVLYERISISMMRNPRLTPYAGPHIFFPQDIKAGNRDSHEFEVTEQLLQALPYADVWRLSLWPGFKQAGIFRRSGMKIEVQQTFLLPLTEPEEVLFHHFKEPLRRNIRKAEKEIVITSGSDGLHELYEFQKATLFEKRVEQPYSELQMKVLLDACIAHNAGTLWVARQDGAIQAVVWNVWDTKTSYYLMGAKDPATVNYKAMSALLWQCIREAKVRGNVRFDFEGSMDKGVQRFFRSFGGDRELYLVLKRDGHWLWKILRALRIK